MRRRCRWRHSPWRRFTDLFPISRKGPPGARGSPCRWSGSATTLYNTKLFGAGAGAELFLFPCALLAIVGFSAKDAIASRALVVVIYCIYLGLHGRYGAPLQNWTAADQAGLFPLNAFSAASLTAFIGLRFATAE